MAWFKSKEEKEREKQEEEENRVAAKLQAEARRNSIVQEREYNHLLAKVIITPETQEQYQNRVGYPVELIDILPLTKNNLGVIFYQDRLISGGSLQLKKILVEAGIEALVNTNFSDN